MLSGFFILSLVTYFAIQCLFLFQYTYSDEITHSRRRAKSAFYFT